MPTPAFSFPTSYQHFIYLSRYSRFLWEQGRRETWPETVTRYFTFFEEHLGEMCKYKLEADDREELYNAVLGLKVMPSMRCLMTAGEALHRENIAGYNCAYMAFNRPQAFDELLYVLMNGTGCGFSVERDFVVQMPTIAEEFHSTDTTIQVADSKLGWAKGYKELIGLLYQGLIPKWDLSKLRPAGAALKTFGGRASGPEPLNELFKFAEAIFKGAAGRKLMPIEVHDLACKTGEVVLVGGVRRAALLSLSNVFDDHLRHAKAGQWWIEHPERALANNSACYQVKPGMDIFMNEWKALYESKSGERGIFNRAATIQQITKAGRRNPEYEFGINPCSEIILRDREFCNLTEAVARTTDTMDKLRKKVRWASILGTWQSTLINFKYVTPKWKQNCEEERLLGVSLTGTMDCPLLNGIDTATAKRLADLKEVAIETNKEWAKKLKISPSVAITCNKPSGTVSQLVDASSGIHPRYSGYYIRSVRMDKKDPLYNIMVAQGFPHEEDLTKPSHVGIFSFPIQAPKDAVIREHLTAVQQLEYWEQFQDYWCEHKPSVTITVKEHEWMDVGAWVYRHFDKMSGVSFLPHSEHSYRQAPYQECTEAEYKAFLAKMPKDANWNQLADVEKSDMTTGSQILACSSGNCEV